MIFFGQGFAQGLAADLRRSLSGRGATPVVDLDALAASGRAIARAKTRRTTPSPCTNTYIPFTPLHRLDIHWTFTSQACVLDRPHLDLIPRPDLDWPSASTRFICVVRHLRATASEPLHTICYIHLLPTNIATHAAWYSYWTGSGLNRLHSLARACSSLLPTERRHFESSTANIHAHTHSQDQQDAAFRPQG